MNTIYTAHIQDAIELAVRVHEHDHKQKRKGKDIPYITHPLTVGLILARAGASEDVIVAGILHDTLEDSVKEHKVTRAMLKKKFGPNVANLVSAVTEHHKDLPWKKRKVEAIAHIAHFSKDELLVKSGDMLNNISELVRDVKNDGVGTFKRFNAPDPKKENTIWYYTEAIRAIVKSWPENPLAQELRDLATSFAKYS